MQVAISIISDVMLTLSGDLHRDFAFSNDAVSKARNNIIAYQAKAYMDTVHR